MKKTKLFVLLCFLAACAVTNAQTGSINNESIIAMHKAAISDTTIISIIKNGYTSFMTDAASLTKLKTEGVNETIIAEMVKKTASGVAAKSSTMDDILKQVASAKKNFNTGGDNGDGDEQPLPYGVYTVKKTMLLPSTFSTTESNSFLHNNVSGFINAKTKATLSGKESANKFTVNDTLLIITEDDFGTGSISSPGDLILVKLEARKDTRQITISKESAGGAVDGISNNDKVLFTPIPVTKKIYKVPLNSCAPGQYALIPSSKMARMINTKVFDFSIQ